MKPFAESSEQNKEPILSILMTELAHCARVLEVGSGTGQHAVFFAEKMPHLRWICSDLSENHAGIQMWLDEANRQNIEGPLLLDAREEWPALQVDAVYSANAIHIMSWEAVQRLIENVGRTLGSGGKLCLYGPFMYDGQHTAESNARFDAWLKERDPVSGVRDVMQLTELLSLQEMELINDYEMPVNNRILIWQKV
ncbi:MAG: class I SAM-dependent methyltransferase [Gammaproteobacteria bacterium]|nr:class I SAM-dependent methyltransferase [Gammaproteobacteria bacterium]